MKDRSCPECGARLPQGAERCDLCGAPLEVQDGSGGTENAIAESADQRAGEDIPEPSTPQEVKSEEVFCNACGAKNPPRSNFCSHCGARLSPVGESVGGARHEGGKPPPPAPPASAAPTAPPSPSAGTSSQDSGDSQRDLTRRVGILVGLAILVVVGLYTITVVSKQRAPIDTDAAVGVPADSRAASVIQEREAIPIGEAYRDRVDSLQAVIDEADAAESIGARRRLVDLLIGIGRVDRAAIEQQRVARISDEAADWKKAGNLLFDWMEMTEPASKSDVALLAIDAYKQVLAHQPDDLDARADLGWAYQYDPQNPMEAIRQTNLVLEESPEHLTANYNKGVFLMRINRLDDASRQFERVKSIAGDESPYYRQAQMWIDTIRDSQAQQGAS